MMSNRQSRQKNKHEDAGDSDHGMSIQPKQSHCDPEQATISGLKNVMKEWTNDHELYFEPFLRRVVREEVERIFRDLCPRATVTQADVPRATPLELRFINKLPDKIFTHTNMVAEDKTPIQIALFYVGSQSVVNVGPLSSIKIEICALNGDFVFNGGEDRTEHEFNVNILRERDGKRPLLNGDRFVTLKNGVGCINKIMFTDNSRWIRNGKFRLGAKVVQPISNEINIKEGLSEPFKVRDYRGEANKKHYPPSLNDEVWRLEQIAKDRIIHKQLSSNGILTVQDLLRLYTTNPSSLLEVLGSISKKSRQSIIEHAKTCVIDDDKLYIYHTAEQSIGLFFNSIYVLVGVIFDEQNFRSLDTLTHSEKHLVEMLKQHAYNNVNNIKPIDETSLSYLTPLACLGAGQSKATEPGLQDFNAFTAQEGYGQLHASTSYIGEGVHNYQTCADPLPDIRDMPLNGESWTPNGSHLPVMQGDYLMENDGSHIQFTNCCPPCTTWGQENGFYNMRPDFSHSHFINSTVSMSSKAKPKTLWYKIRSAFKYVISVRRDAAAKRNAKLLN